jgi:SAM-dependent methyltransferase
METVRVCPPEVNSYDVVPYPGGAAAGAQCHRLEAIAALFGLAPIPPASARVLELGCGAGRNLAAQALAHPAARFVGCDASAAAVAAARELVEALGLANVELRRQDLCEVDASWGKFDYILCHGVFSWVDPQVRRKLLEIFRHNLAPQGIGYLSYNALPGWHLRRVVRDLLRFHTAGCNDPEEAVAQARGILALAAESHSADDAFGKLLREEYFLLSRRPDGYLYHEMLAEHNQSFYFQEFLEQIEAAGLQYLGDADFSQMFAWDLPEAARALLDGMALPAREQYLDHLRGATFRSSLLCQAEAVVERRIDHRVLERMSVALAPQARWQVSDGPEEGRLVTGAAELVCNHPPTLAALRLLEECRPAFVPVRLLRAGAPGAGTGAELDADGLTRFLLDSVTAGALEAALSPPCIAGRVSERPTVSPLARLEAQQGDVVTNQRQQRVRLTAASSLVARLLDGGHDRDELAAIVGAELRSGRLSLSPFDDCDDGDVNGLVERVLNLLCRLALLTA